MKKTLVIYMILLLFACKSTEVENLSLSNSLLGILFDNKSNPIQNATITFYSNNDREMAVVTTDINGKFFIPELEFNHYRVKIESPSLPVTTIIADHFDIENILIIRVSTYKELLTKLEENIKNREITTANENIIKLESTYSSNEYFKYLKARHFYNQGRYKESESLLLHQIPYNNPYTFLLLADIYQYKLKDDNKALYFLGEFINIEYSEAVTTRIKELEDAIKNIKKG